ncbi:dTDP-4-dehydrorhamnose, partial [Acrasis kona]
MEMEDTLVEALPDADPELLKMDDITSNFKNLSKNCINFIEQRLEGKCSAYFAEVFGKGWYSREKGSDENMTCVEKAFNYLTGETEELISYMNQDYLRPLIKLLIERLIATYIDMAIKKPFTLKENEDKIINRDVDCFHSYISDSFEWKEDAMEPLLAIQKILTTTSLEEFDVDLSMITITFDDL